jgi:hypothetical protein
MKVCRSIAEEAREALVAQLAELALDADALRDAGHRLAYAAGPGGATRRDAVRFGRSADYTDRLIGQLQEHLR